MNEKDQQVWETILGDMAAEYLEPNRIRSYYTNEEDEYQDYDEEDQFDEDDESDEDDPYNIESMAIRMMDVMVENNIDSFILLKDPIVARWWADILQERKRIAEKKQRREEAVRKAQEDERARAELLSRLTPEEKRLLGIK
jgi:hypothetical protein